MSNKKLNSLKIKKELIESGILKKRLEFDRLYHSQDCDLEKIEEISIQMYDLYGDMWELAKLYNNNYFKRRTNVNRRIKDIYNSSSVIYFGTLTFEDSFLAPPFNVDKRRRYVRDFLNEYCINYIANIDFGKKNGREHYHCIIALHSVYSIDFLKWKYGFYNFKVVGSNDCDFKRISIYLTKLTNHTIKDTCKDYKIIYCRKKIKKVDKVAIEVNANKQ